MLIFEWMLEHGLTIPDDDVYLGPVVDMGGMDKKTSPLFSAAALFFLSLEKGSILANAEIKKQALLMIFWICKEKLLNKRSS